MGDFLPARQDKRQCNQAITPINYKLQAKLFHLLKVPLLCNCCNQRGLSMQMIARDGPESFCLRVTIMDDAIQACDQ